MKIPIPLPERYGPGDVGLNNAAFLCPHCGILSLNQLQSNLAYTDRIRNPKDPADGQLYAIDKRHLIYRCVKCHKETYFLVQDAVVIHEQNPGGDRTIKRVAEAAILHQFPLAIPATHASVPVDVKKAMIEAEKCLAVGAWNGSATMTRRAVDAICQSRGAEGADLYHRLQWLRDNHLITPDIWQWAEELRILGRSGAHPEWEDVEPDDATYAVKFLREIIRYVYINPAERNERMAKETARKKE